MQSLAGWTYRAKYQSTVLGVRESDERLTPSRGSPVPEGRWTSAALVPSCVLYSSQTPVSMPLLPDLAQSTPPRSVSM